MNFPTSSHLASTKPRNDAMTITVIPRAAAPITSAMSVSGASEGCQRGVRGVSDDIRWYQIDVRGVSEGHVQGIRWVSDGCPTGVRGMLDGCQMGVHEVSDDCQMGTPIKSVILVDARFSLLPNMQYCTKLRDNQLGL